MTTQLDSNKVLRKAIIKAMDKADQDIRDGYFRICKVTGALKPKRSTKEVMKLLGFTYRNGHARFVYAAYTSILFNETMSEKWN